jgi:cobyrinic acid a,c-diamide synthase
MLTSVRNAVNGGLPTIAECGGFMYLHEQLSDFPMVGVIPAKAFETKSLKHFGYITLEAKSNNLLCKSGDSIKAHEFHYWNSTDDGNTFTAKKARRDVEYPCIHSSETLFAGFPHIFFPSNPKSAEHFAEKAAGFAEKHN